MKLILLIIFIIMAVGCTTFYQNSTSVNRACKSGIKEYDDGTTNFSCYNQSEKSNSEGVKK